MKKCPITEITHKNEPQSPKCSDADVEKFFGCKRSEMMTLREYDRIKDPTYQKFIQDQPKQKWDGTKWVSD